MLAGSLLVRSSSRRLVSSVSRASSSSTRQQQANVVKYTPFASSEHEATRQLLPIMTAATLLCGWGLLTSREENEDINNKSVAQCLIAKTDVKAAEVEAKFATYWPRNIMILFGPPGMCTTSNIMRMTTQLALFLQSCSLSRLKLIIYSDQSKSYQFLIVVVTQVPARVHTDPKLKNYWAYLNSQPVICSVRP